MKNKSSTIALLLIFLVGLSLLLYPTFSNYWNSFTQSRAIASYSEKVAEIDTEEYDRILQYAKNYNDLFVGRTSLWVLNDDQRDAYDEQLNVFGNGVMGYIEIEKIKCSLPIYHGTSDSVLQIAVGHLDGSSLPVGGTGTHCVLSGHRGLPSAKLFTDLDQLGEGDTFVLYVLDEMYTYQVDQIRIITPDDLSALTVEPDKDLCTLVTCTPYGVNSHRLLVRGQRIDNIIVSNVKVTADAMQIEPMIVAPVVAIPILFSLLMMIVVKDIRMKLRGRKIRKLQK
ncbi:MAG: class C sortase [Clostridia bacterium]|nr:class C sortase [Clostridia bacterium]